MLPTTLSYACPPPLFWREWYVPLTVTATATPHAPPSLPSLPPKPCTPHPVSGGDQLCQSRQATHTHSHTCIHIQDAGWGTKLLVLPMKRSHASAFSLFSSHSLVRGRHDNIVVDFSDQKTTVWRKESGISNKVDYIFAVLRLRSWDAGGAQREQQVGGIRSWMLSSSPRWPWCLFTVTGKLDLGGYSKSCLWLFLM